MPLTLGLNLSSLRAQTQLSKTSSELSTVFERLSSGQRINRASDDAAGLAIADSLNADARVYTQGVRNLNDGISVLNIADGALQELTNITFRLTELAEQAANGSLGSTQRASLDEEAQALKAEHFRIAQSTEFNGRKLFDGSYGQLSLQAGYGTAGSISDGLSGNIGDGTFTSSSTYGVGTIVRSPITADLDGDGFPDIIAPNSSAGTISILFGNGTGSFQGAQTIQVGAGVRSVAVSDLNGDGNYDLVTADTDTNTTSILLGNGDGTFQARQTITLSSIGAFEIKAGDFNGDGHDDIAIASYYNDYIEVYEGNGDGSFGARQTFVTDSAPQSLTIGDVNNDGIVDVLTSNNGFGSISVLLGNGDGTFQAKQDYAAGITPDSIELSDLNGDGSLDAVVANRSTNTFTALLGNGDGTFQAGVSYSGYGVFNSVSIGDVNGDGIEDIVAGAARVNVFLGAGDGTFEAVVSYQAGASASFVTLDDISADGVLDIIAGNSGTISILIGDVVDGVAPLLDFTLTTMADARQALSRFEQKLDHLSKQRGEIGAFQSRIESASAVTVANVENYRAAESRIRDADIAQESASLVRLQILQQASAAVLGQANQQPELVLQLLRGGA